MQGSMLTVGICAAALFGGAGVGNWRRHNRRDVDRVSLNCFTYSASASFNNIQVLTELLPGNLVADMIAILGSMFFVVGDIDK